MLERLHIYPPKLATSIDKFRDLEGGNSSMFRFEKEQEVFGMQIEDIGDI